MLKRGLCAKVLPARICLHKMLLRSSYSLSCFLFIFSSSLPYSIHEIYANVRFQEKKRKRKKVSHMKERLRYSKPKKRHFLWSIKKNTFFADCVLLGYSMNRCFCLNTIGQRNESNGKYPPCGSLWKLRLC